MSYLIPNSTGDVMRWAPDQCDRVAELLRAARDWHGPIVAPHMSRSHGFHK